jgi:hypothetical protein
MTGRLGARRYGARPLEPVDRLGERLECRRDRGSRRLQGGLHQPPAFRADVLGGVPGWLPGGVRLQPVCDFSGQRLHLVDRRTGEEVPVELFVAVLGASNYTYAESIPSQRLLTG